jgi:hypothetical protein
MLLPFLASVASAQDDVWKTLAKGDRVQITFRSGNMLLGNLAPKPGDPRLQPPAVDYSTATEITIDLSLEYPGLNGTMSIPRREIKEIRKLQNLDAATMKRIQEELTGSRRCPPPRTRSARRANRSAAEGEGPATRRARGRQGQDKEKGALLSKTRGSLKKGKELLKRFPPDKYGPKTVSDALEAASAAAGLQRRARVRRGRAQRLWTLVEGPAVRPRPTRRRRRPKRRSSSRRPTAGLKDKRSCEDLFPVPRRPPSSVSFGNGSRRPPAPCSTSPLMHYKGVTLDPFQEQAVRVINDQESLSRRRPPARARRSSPVRDREVHGRGRARPLHRPDQGAVQPEVPPA